MKPKTELQKTYASAHKQVKGMLKDIEKQLDKDAKAFKKDSRNYGFLGRLGYIRSELSAILNFVKQY